MENESARRKDTRPSSPCGGRSGAQKPCYDSRIFLVPCGSRSGAQRVYAQILPTHQKDKAKFSALILLFLKGSYFFTWTRLKQIYISFKTAAYLRMKRVPSATVPAHYQSTDNTSYPLFSHRTLPLSNILFSFFSTPITFFKFKETSKPDYIGL